MVSTLSTYTTITLAVAADQELWVQVEIDTLGRVPGSQVLHVLRHAVVQLVYTGDRHTLLAVRQIL